MPIIQIHLLEGRSVQQKRDLVADITAAVTGALSVRPEQVRILIDEVSAEHFAVAGQTAQERMSAEASMQPVQV
ncbi:2-hydroxymuconate tautomerase [Pandoraea terrae]|uniref:Tautomerase n=1 Tax=Pandoraea terrae TaxID=1537710 RepID=A0A5E4U860_9BURK|nr:2-hydroxymuconate tautomerase [Pandoraea terrae]VVD96246.1 2-hydroxymuconate tautomerase [Pandoraea terrae]